MWIHVNYFWTQGLTAFHTSPLRHSQSTKAAVCRIDLPEIYWDLEYIMIQAPLGVENLTFAQSRARKRTPMISNIDPCWSIVQWAMLIHSISNMAENSFMVQSLEAAAAAIACVADGIQRNPSEWHSALEEHLMTSIYLFIDLSIFLSIYFYLFLSISLSLSTSTH